MLNRNNRVGAMLILGVSLILTASHQLSFAAQPRNSVRPGQAVRNGSSVLRRVTSTRPAVRPTSQPAASRPAAEGRVEVIAYYFHRTLRCPSCLHIEATARQIIRDRFAGEIDAGLVGWEAVDVQKPGKEHFVTDYRLSTSSLVLVKMVDGRQAAWKNCEKAWDLHRNEPAFADYIQSEVVSMLRQTAAATQPETPAPDQVLLPRMVNLGAKRLASSKQMAAILGQLKAELAGKARIESIDVLENGKAAAPYRARVIPTQIFYDAQGKETWRHEGALSKEIILSRLREAGMN